MEFRLLGGSSDPPSDRPSIVLEDRHWSISDPLDISSDLTHIPQYICISYVWGSGRVPNPIHPTVPMSDHTLPAIVAAIRNHDPCHSASMIWIDAFCVPIEPVAKRATLESMGFIYSKATQVVVVLSNEAFEALEKTGQLDSARTSGATVECLDVLENNGWIRSVWTYQEVANSQDLLFIGEGMVGKFIRGMDFLNRFGHYLYTWRKTNDYTTAKFREKYPFLDAMESVVADWIVLWYVQDMKRSVLQILSQMEHRSYDDPSNVFYSMIGAITTTPAPRRSKPSIESLAETFMELCEGIGDYSFMYTSTERDKRPGRKWRPNPGILRSILPWHCDGKAQLGEKDPRGIRLKEVVVLKRSASVSKDGRKFGLDVTQDKEEGQSDAVIATNVYTMLQHLGFTGSGEYLITTRGFFFPQWPILSATLVVLWVNPAITWRVAFPGMADISVEGQRRYIPGVFTGFMPSAGVDEVIIEENA